MHWRENAPLLCIGRSNGELCVEKDFVRTIISHRDAEARRGKKGTHEKVDGNGDYSSYGH